MAECAIEFINHLRDEDERFCLMANFFDPHQPFGAPQEFSDKINSDAIPAPNTRENGVDLSNIS